MSPRTLYIDPGTAWTAWVIVDLTPAAPVDFPVVLHVVAHDKIETGQLVDLPPEKVTRRTRADGVEVVRDKRRECSRSDRVRVASMLAVIAQRYEVRRVVMERVGKTFLRGGSKGGDIEQAESAKQTALVEEKILDLMEAAGIEVVPVRRQTWANRLREYLPAKVVGAPGMSRAELLPVLSRGFDAWPAAAGEHERDCGGMALWDHLPPLESKRKGRAASAGPPRPRGKREKRTTPRGSRKRALMGDIDLAKARATSRAYMARTRGAQTAAVLAASGCTCKTPGQSMKGRHKASCPLHRPKGGPGAQRLIGRRPCAGCGGQMRREAAGRGRFACADCGLGVQRRPRRSTAEVTQDKRAIAAEARAASGCTCKGRRFHKRECALSTSTVAKEPGPRYKPCHLCGGETTKLPGCHNRRCMKCRPRGRLTKVVDGVNVSG